MEPALVGTEVNSIVLWALLMFITLLISAVFFFVKKILNRVDSMWDKLLVLEISVHRFDDDVGFVRSAKSELKEKLEDIIILRRDQVTIWKKIDALQAKVGH